jgi:uncharacterized protein YktA (UPF0223 family)
MDVLFHRLGTTAFLLTWCFTAISQTIIEGKLLNDEDKTPIPFANIGILNTPVGTISNQDGTFEIVIPDKHLHDTLLFAALGFERKWFPVQKLLGGNILTISLREQTIVLKNVTVKSKRLKPLRSYEIGNKNFNTGSLFVDSVAAGSAMALLIENRYPSYFPELSLPFFITKAKLRISYNTFDDFRIRIRFLSVDSITGLPDKDLIEESIIASSGMRKGWLNFDLSKHIIRIEVPSFFVVFEWLIEEDERKTLMDQYREFKRIYPKKVSADTVIVEGEKIVYHTYHGYRAGTSFGSSSEKSIVDNFKCFYRNNSYGRWKRSSTILSANVVISNY